MQDEWFTNAERDGKDEICTWGVTLDWCFSAYRVFSFLCQIGNIMAQALHTLHHHRYNQYLHHWG